MREAQSLVVMTRDQAPVMLDEEFGNSYRRRKGVSKVPISARRGWLGTARYLRWSDGGLKALKSGFIQVKGWWFWR